MNVQTFIPADRYEPLSLVERMGVFPSSGDIIHPLLNPHDGLVLLGERYAAHALEIDERNGLRMVFKDWRFRVRLIPGEAAVILRVDSRGDLTLLSDKTQELLSGLKSQPTGLFPNIEDHTVASV